MKQKTFMILACIISMQLGAGERSAAITWKEVHARFADILEALPVTAAGTYPKPAQEALAAYHIATSVDACTHTRSCTPERAMELLAHIETYTAKKKK